VQRQTDTTRLSEEIMARCDLLASFSEEVGALTRTFLSEPMRAVHSTVRTWMEEAGMQVRVDPAGNIIGRYGASTPNARTLLIGSHLDTVRNAGKYDGMLGVLLGLAVVEALHEQSRHLPYAVEVIGFSEEEGVRYRVPFLGSRAVTGTFDPALLELVDEQGVRMYDALSEFGCNPSATAGAAYDPNGPLGYLEVHIEQGPRLAALEQPLGVVSAIVGQRRVRLRFIGKAGHAGTAPMTMRQDALVGASAFVLEASRLAKGVPDLTATVGQCDVKPNIVNVIPAEATLSLDLRHPDDTVRDSMFEQLAAKAQKIAQEHNLALELSPASEQGATPMDERLTRLLSDAAGEATPVLVSGAGHDAMVMAPFTPTTMLFVRSPNGISHHPDEFVLPEDVQAALETLLRFMERLEAAHAV
jgi:allantoate deiminase